MYSWGDDMEDWSKPGAYRFGSTTADTRKKDAERARSAGPRTYDAGRAGPNVQLTDPKKHVSTKSPTPLIVGVDVTGSMQRWPAAPKPPNRAPSTARSRSASGMTTIGFLPPSSRQGD